MGCELCGAEFKSDDMIMVSVHGLFHEEECFMEYVYEQLGVRMRNYKDYVKETAEVDKCLPE